MLRKRRFRKHIIEKTVAIKEHRNLGRDKTKMARNKEKRIGVLLSLLDRHPEGLTREDLLECAKNDALFQSVAEQALAVRYMYEVGRIKKHSHFKKEHMKSVRRKKRIEALSSVLDQHPEGLTRRELMSIVAYYDGYYYDIFEGQSINTIEKEYIAQVPELNGHVNLRNEVHLQIKQKSKREEVTLGCFGQSSKRTYAERVDRCGESSSVAW